MPKKKHRTPQACIHLYNLPVPPAGYPHNPARQNAKRTQFSPGHPDYAKRTQFHPANSQSPKAKSCFSRNEPNFHPATPIMRNEPNFPLPNSQSPKAKSCFSRNEPNSRAPSVPPPSPCPIMQNKPNFSRGGPVEDQKNETNPILTRQNSSMNVSPCV